MKASKFQFSNPMLESLRFDVREDFNAESFEGIAMESNTEVMISGERAAEVALTVKIGNGNNNQPFDITVKMKANFIWDETISEESSKRMLKINGATVLLSYIRPLIASLTSNSKYPTLNIPFIDFTNEECK